MIYYTHVMEKWGGECSSMNRKPSLKEYIKYAYSIGLIKPVVGRSDKYKERDDWKREDIIKYADRILEYRRLLEEAYPRSTASRNGKLFITFNYEFPNLCIKQSEFIGLCLSVEKRKIKQLFCPVCGKRNGFRRIKHGVPIWNGYCSQCTGQFISSKSTSSIRVLFNTGFQ